MFKLYAITSDGKKIIQQEIKWFDIIPFIKKYRSPSTIKVLYWEAANTRTREVNKFQVDGTKFI